MFHPGECGLPSSSSPRANSAYFREKNKRNKSFNFGNTDKIHLISGDARACTEGSYRKRCDAGGRVRCSSKRIDASCLASDKFNSYLILTQLHESGLQWGNILGDKKITQNLKVILKPKLGFSQ